MLYRVLPVCVVAVVIALAVNTPVRADDAHEGLVVKAGDGKLTMTDKDGKNEHTHDVAADAKITCDGKDCKLADLKKGYKVKVTVKKDGGKEQATRIEARTF